MKQKSMSINDVATFTTEKKDYKIPFQGMSKSEAKNRKKKADLCEKCENYDDKNIFISVISNNIW